MNYKDIIEQEQFKQLVQKTQEEFDNAIVEVLKKSNLNDLEKVGTIKLIADYLLQNQEIMNNNSCKGAVEIAYNDIVNNAKPVPKLKVVCNHEFVEYQGLFENSKHCSKCGEKQ